MYQHYIMSRLSKTVMTQCKNVQYESHEYIIKTLSSASAKVSVDII